MDRRKVYSAYDIEQWRSAELKHLESLVLMGTPVISFYPDTFSTTVSQLVAPRTENGQRAFV